MSIVFDLEFGGASPKGIPGIISWWFWVDFVDCLIPLGDEFSNRPLHSLDIFSQRCYIRDLPFIIFALRSFSIPSFLFMLPFCCDLLLVRILCCGPFVVVPRSRSCRQLHRLNSRRNEHVLACCLPHLQS